MSQDEVFDLICKNEGLTTKEISQKLGLDRSTVSNSLILLRKKKLVKYKCSKAYIKIYIKK